MLYGSCAWCTASERQPRIQAQKRAARVILDADIGDRSELFLDDWIGCRLRKN